MSFRHWPTALIFVCTTIGPLQAMSADAGSGCNEQQQARLQGDKLLQNRLGTELQNLAEVCRGLTTLGPSQVEHQQALNQVKRREGLLREALGTGDAQLIELRRNQLAKTREKLESLRP